LEKLVGFSSRSMDRVFWKMGLMPWKRVTERVVEVPSFNGEIRG